MNIEAGNELMDWSDGNRFHALQAKGYSDKIDRIFNYAVQEPWKGLQGFATEFWDLIRVNSEEARNSFSLSKVQKMLTRNIERLESEGDV